ncbi:MAG: C40 family peptidase [Rhizobiales bacterium]|nr:C40 family peptidase [Hyphomicrobiales bacterium]MBI3672357.1 C40 family peptidase [Hyphomicrobiales bacterium]
MTEASHIVRLARAWIGTPYRHQASLKGVGCDCLGLIRGVWREAHGEEPEEVPPYSAGWAEADASEVMARAAGRHMRIVPPTEFQAGDVLLFRWRPHLPAKHAGIAASLSRMIHAQEDARVSEIHLSAWWRRHLAFAFRFPGVDA